MVSRIPMRWALCLWCMLALLLATALKGFYSVAGASELGWMLRPLALLLQALMGQSFERSAGGEWSNAALGIVLVKGCAGVNFMAMSLLGWCWLQRPQGETSLPRRALRSWPYLCFVALLLAWITALLVNTARIIVALAAEPLLDGWLGEARAHRLIGLLVFLPALTLQLLLVERRVRWHTLLIAATIYAGVMLLVPLLGGRVTMQGAAFRDHVIMVCVMLAPLLAWAALTARRPCVSRKAEAPVEFVGAIDAERWGEISEEMSRPGSPEGAAGTFSHEAPGYELPGAVAPLAAQNFTLKTRPTVRGAARLARPPRPLAILMVSSVRLRQ